jgi:hypothetical protein
MVRANRQLLHIEVHFDAWEEDPDNAGNWERTPFQKQGVAWLNGQPHSKGRINYQKYVERWVQGAQPTIERSFDIAFDGTEGTTAEYFIKHSGRTVKTRTGLISAQPGARLFKDLESQIATGQIFSTAFHGDGDNSLPEMLARYEHDGVRFAISREPLDGRDAIRITAGDPKADHHSWWLDPERQFALLGQDIVANGKLNRRIRVGQLAQAATGVWYPSEAYFQRSLLAETAKTLNLPETVRYQYRASAVTANAADFDQRVYHITFPPGYTVTDKIRGRQYRVTAEQAELQTQLNEVADKAIAELSPENLHSAATRGF